jgi:CheY-like chemotaxis protein
MDGLKGRCVLVVEDEAVVAMDLCALLGGAGCRVLGPVSGVRRALETIEHKHIDGAILDVGLDGEKVFPVADALARRGTPFVFLTGYDAETLPPAHRGRRCVIKPAGSVELLEALRAAIRPISALGSGSIRMLHRE